MGSTLHYLIKQIDMFIEHCRQNLLDKKPGAFDDYLAMIWVHMLWRPQLTNMLSDKQKSVFYLRGKFNSILEEWLADGMAEHHKIMSIEVPAQQFDLSGDLTALGFETFWKEIDCAMKKFNTDQITLRPRVFAAKNSGNQNSFIKSVIKKPHTRRMRLPMLPPSDKTVPVQKRSRSRSSSR